MAEFVTPQFWVAVAEIILVNILLSGDNAVVIALACRNLSHRQRRYGIFWGVLGAIGLRILLTFFAMSLMGRFRVRVLAGGGLLGYIAGEMAVEDPVVQPGIAANAIGLASLAPPVFFGFVVIAGMWLIRRRNRARSR